jgi:hypothetical protein
MLKCDLSIPKKTIRIVVLCLGLTAITMTSFDGALSNGFVDWDDQVYVTENYRVCNGLTWENIVWAFSDTHTGNWHPLTWLSHMVDCQLYGLNPAGHHLTSILLHTVNVLLLFLLLQGMTGAFWSSVFVAMVFAIHPLRVESVAWVAERKDVLSGLFFMLTLAAYSSYTRGPTAWKYLCIMAVLCLGLLCKAMLVTVPFVLLLLDWWPFQRISGSTEMLQRPSRLIWEKVPLLSISVIFSVVAFWAQRDVGAVAPAESLGLYNRLINATVSYISYIGKLFYPKDLAVLYPFVGSRLLRWKGILCFVMLGVVSVVIIRLRKCARWAVVGWLWYLGMLVPVIGLVQVGSQVMADRYTYLPSIGFLIVITWTLREVAGRFRVKRVITVIAATVIMILLMFATWIQVGYWRDSVSLFVHAIDVTDDNHVMHLNLGLALEKMGEYEEAMNQYDKAMSLAPWKASIMLNIAAVRIKQNKVDEAISSYEKLLKMKAGLDLEAYCGLGTVYLRQGKFELAEENLRQALSLDADYPIALNNLARVLHQQGKTAEAVNFWKAAIEIDTFYINAMSRLAWVLATTDQEEIFDPGEAVKNALRVCHLTEYKEPQLLDVLAAAYAANECYIDAIDTATKAYELAMAMGKAELAGKIKERLSLYRDSKRYVESRQDIENKKVGTLSLPVQQNLLNSCLSEVMISNYKAERWWQRRISEKQWT